MTNSAQTWLPKNCGSALDDIPNPYYCRTKIHMSAPSCNDGPVWPCTPCALPVQLPPTTAKASALARLMSGVANRSCDIEVTDYACPQHSRACGEQESPR